MKLQSTQINAAHMNNKKLEKDRDYW